MHLTDTEHLRRVNTLRVLGEIRKWGKISRIEIADKTGLSRATVTALTAGLIDEGLITASEPGEESGSISTAAGRGRPRVALRLNPRAATVVGVKLSLHQIAFSVTDFAGNLLTATTMAVRVGDQSPERVSDLVDKGVRAAIAKLDLDLSQVAGIGIGLPGFVDSSSGICHWSPIFGSGTTPLGAMVRARLDRPIRIDNDANLVTLAEQWFGFGRAHKDFLVVTVEHGVGMGLVIDGQLFRGARGFGSEFGHIKLQREGAACRCGQRGCIEAYVADYAIVRAGADLLGNPDIDNPIAVQKAVDQLTDLARSGDRPTMKIYQDMGEWLGLGLANLINVLNPPVIVMSGERMRVAEFFEPAMRAAVRSNTLSAVQGKTEIILHRWGDDFWARGAAALMLQHLYKAPRTGNGAKPKRQQKLSRLAGSDS
ncbi:MAG: ROK family protein [Alphaproteobacteria bacterium]